MVLGALDDLVPKLFQIMFGSEDEALKQNKVQSFLNEAMPKTLQVLEKRACQDAKFLHGDKPTLADLALFSFIKHAIWKNFGKASFTDSTYPRLSRVVENVAQLPTLQNYISSSSE